MIPKIIHQTSKTADIPAQWRQYQARLKALHSSWEYHHWTDTENLNLVESSAPQFLPLYRSLPKGIMKADMIRYVYMEVFGGLYLDFDYEFLKPFDLLDKAVVLPREFDDAAGFSLGNSVLASVPGHPFWKIVLTELEKGVAALGREPIEDEITGLTGPGLVTRAYQSAMSNNRDIYVAPRAQFNPVFPANNAEYLNLVNSGNTYGIHHCDGTWRAKTIPQRVMRKLASLRNKLKE